jgi:hypothetical protein
MRPFALVAVLFSFFLLVDPARSAKLSRRGVCMVSGCSGEVCAAEEVNTICIAPTCGVSCLTKFGTCKSNSDYPTAKFQCGWDTSATEKEYQACLAACGTDGTDGDK